MSHTVDTEGYYSPGPDERFTDPEIVAKVLELLQEHPHALTAIISAQWERKGQIQRGPLTEESPYRKRSFEQYAISIEIDLDAVYSENGTLAEVKELAEGVLIERADAAAHAELARLEAERDRVEAERARIEAALAKARVGDRVLKATPFSGSK